MKQTCKICGFEVSCLEYDYPVVHAMDNHFKTYHTQVKKPLRYIIIMTSIQMLKERKHIGEH